MQTRRIELTRAEAIVLSDWIDRLEKDLPRLRGFCDRAEEHCLGRIAGQLEEQLEELFDPRYGALVTAAKAEILGEEEDVGDAPTR